MGIVVGMGIGIRVETNWHAPAMPTRLVQPSGSTWFCCRVLACQEVARGAPPPPLPFQGGRGPPTWDTPKCLESLVSQTIIHYPQSRGLE